ncbi:MAG TPA: membrane protein insertase YidC [Pyrinomonadaceae bacterium]|jgi:YidC/Oxa1 family membrane protein insertase
MDQKRFLLALVLSIGILVGWNYFFSPTPPPQNSNTQQQQTATASPTPAPQTPTQTTQPAQNETAPAPSSDDVPPRTLTIESPLYRVRLDSRGALATSWVIKQNKDSGRAIYSIAGNKNNPQPLELISPEGLKKEPRDAPLRLETGDASLDTLLLSRNYRIEGIEADEGNAAPAVELKPGEQKRVDFVLRDASSGLEVTKSLTFSADHYAVELAFKASRGGQQIPSVKLHIGPSIGDQGVPHYTFYSVAPEGIYAVNQGDVVRTLGADVNKNEQAPGRLNVPGAISWAGVGDTYFAMAAIPPKPVEGLEYRTSKYEHAAGETKEERYLITGLLNLPADGSPTQLYVGPKDHYLLGAASEYLNGKVGREVDLEGLIDYGFLGSISRPLAVPILWSIKRLNALTGSYGVAIILFTIIIYSLFFPLKWRSSKSMKKAQKLAPRMKEIQEKIKGLKQNDPRLKELQMEQLRLMKEGNPLGGCLPLLIQMPFLFALFRAITISLDFRQASFLWMPDLSAADPWHLLPVLMAASMLVLQMITPAPSADPLQRKMMAVVLPVMMLYMMWSAPAGLLVYWLVGNIVGFSQQLVINRMIKSEDDEEPPQKTSAEKLPSDKPRSGRRVASATAKP